jgi:putative membrane protein insertion efficiency factor
MWAEWPRRALIGLVKGYRLLLSPWLGNSCRFEPTCSVYAIGALQRHGALAGTYLMLHRIGRCGPWCAGGCDPVPEAPPRLFSRLFPPSSPEKQNLS